MVSIFTVHDIWHLTFWSESIMSYSIKWANSTVRNSESTYWSPKYSVYGKYEKSATNTNSKSMSVYGTYIMIDSSKR